VRSTVVKISRVLIANRGEIAVRIIKTCRRMGIESVVTVSEVDSDSLPAQLADRSVCIGPSHPSLSYLNTNAILATALGVKADAIHPGYGFLAEDATFADGCVANGVGFIGPPAAALRLAGNKVRARETAVECGIPVLPASGPLVPPGSGADRAAEAVGYPLLVKASAGGGGRGIRLVNGRDELSAAIETAMAEAEAAFGDGTVYLEQWVADALHIEVQLAGAEGRLTALGDRDCSLQRRHQKVVEEGPALRVPTGTRRAIAEYAGKFGSAAGYSGIGTVEFLYDRATTNIFFLEMNARIQVEHPVTEELTGLDLVELQLLLAQDEEIAPLVASAAPRGGHAIECRITAEDPACGFRPTPGTLSSWRMPMRPGLRTDTHCYPGYRVPPYYDSLLAKLIATASSRDEALEVMLAALDETCVAGIPTNVPFLRRVLADDAVRSGKHNTTWIERFVATSPPAGGVAG
jgi:acetyl-CoA carboxylase, biotin carboxylase subunit